MALHYWHFIILVLSVGFQFILSNPIAAPQSENGDEYDEKGTIEIEGTQASAICTINDPINDNQICK